MPIKIINNIFSPYEIDRIYKAVYNTESVIDAKLGRIRFNHIIGAIGDETGKKLQDIVSGATNTIMTISEAVYVEYNNIHGKPNLPPHVDADSTDILMNIQIGSNTSWSIGINTETYSLNDNCGLLFNPNEEVHWRAHKEFLDGEYVRMLFIRFYNASNLSYNSHLPKSENDHMFKEAREFRDSLRDRTVF
jgi:hypothetical protein